MNLRRKLFFARIFANIVHFHFCDNFWENFYFREKKINYFSWKDSHFCENSKHCTFLYKCKFSQKPAKLFCLANIFTKMSRLVYMLVKKFSLFTKVFANIFLIFVYFPKWFTRKRESSVENIKSVFRAERGFAADCGHSVPMPVWTGGFSTTVSVQKKNCTYFFLKEIVKRDFQTK